MPSRRFATVLAAGLLPLALTACGSSQTPNTYEERPTVDAANASMGDLEVRNLHIEPPVGGSTWTSRTSRSPIEARAASAVGRSW